MQELQDKMRDLQESRKATRASDDTPQLCSSEGDTPQEEEDTPPPSPPKGSSGLHEEEGAPPPPPPTASSGSDVVSRLADGRGLRRPLAGGVHPPVTVHVDMVE